MRQSTINKLGRELSYEVKKLYTLNYMMIILTVIEGLSPNINQLNKRKGNYLINLWKLYVLNYSAFKFQFQQLKASNIIPVCR